MNPMTDRHATTADLPGWNTPDTVLGLSRNPGTWGWATLHNVVEPGPQYPEVLGRDMEGHLYVAAAAAITAKTPEQSTVDVGNRALLTGAEDGVGLWLPKPAYHLVKVIDPEARGEQPDVPRWLPIVEVLSELPAKVPPPRTY
jgi:hypothetical protein